MFSLQYRDSRNSTSFAEMSGAFSQHADDPASRKREPTSGAVRSPALHRLTLIPRIALNRASASFSAQSGEASDQNRQSVIRFDLFRSTCFVRFGPRLSPCPPQPLGAVLRASSRRPSGRFRSRKLVGLVPHSKWFFAPPECVRIMTKPRGSVRAERSQCRPGPALLAPVRH
jgi:hypothetical protein